MKRGYILKLNNVKLNVNLNLKLVYVKLENVNNFNVKLEYDKLANVKLVNVN